MGEQGRLVAESPEQEDVLGRVRDVVLAADDVADRHRRVVDDDGEVVERRAVGADDDEVAAEVGDVDLDATSDEVVEGDDALSDPESEGAATTLRLAGGALVGGEAGASADVAGRLIAASCAASVGLELLGRAVAGIGPVRLEERGAASAYAAGAASGDTGRRDRDAPRRRHRGPRPSQPEPVEPVEDVLLVGDRAASDVGVLEAEDERRRPCGGRAGSCTAPSGRSRCGAGRSGCGAIADGRISPVAGRLSSPGRRIAESRASRRLLAEPGTRWKMRRVAPRRSRTGRMEAQRAAGDRASPGRAGPRA